MKLLLLSRWTLTIGAWIFIALVTLKTFLLYGGWYAICAFLLFSSAGALGNFLCWFLGKERIANT